MKIEFINDFEDFMDLKEPWNSLLCTSGYNSVFLTHEWFSCFIDCFQLKKRLAITLVYDRSELVAILPLYIHTCSSLCLKYNILRSISNVHTPKYSFIFKQGKEHLLGAILRYMKRHMSWDLIQLEYISQDTGLFKEFKELQNYGLKTKTAETKKSPHIMINSNWLTYYDSIPKSFRKHIDSRHRRSERDYVVELERINGDLLDELALDEAFAIEDSGWKGRNGSSVLKNPMAKQFYYSLAFTLNRKNWFELLFLKLSGKRVAFDYNLIYDACYNMVKIGYDEQYKRYSIGNVLRKLVIMNAFQNNYKKYDFLGAADDYKTKLANSADVLHKVFIFNANPISKCLKFLLFDAGELADSLGIKRHYSRIKPLIWGFSR